MALQIHTAPGCLRCQVAKALSEGKGPRIRRGRHQGRGRQGLFPVLPPEPRRHPPGDQRGWSSPSSGTEPGWCRGVGEILAWLQAGDRLKGFVGRSELLHGWIDGLDVSGGDPAHAEDFLTVLRRLKAGGIQIRLETNGRHPGILDACQKKPWPTR